MEQITLNRCLNREAKLYGLSYLGVIGGGMTCLLVWLKFGMTIGIISSTIGYGLSAYVGKRLHSGELQRFIYWHLPFKGMFGGKYLPESHKRCWL